MTSSPSAMPLRSRCLAAFVGAAMLVVSCGSNNTIDTSSESSEEAASTTAPTTEAAEFLRPERVSEQDVDEARAAFVSGQADWEASAVTSYRLDIGVESIGSVQVEVVDGEVVSETIEGTEVDAWFNEPLPRTVDGVFTMLDGIIVQFEGDPTLVPTEDDCGYHFNARFDADLGYPTYLDELGPCDDGVGLSVSVTPTN